LALETISPTDLVGQEKLRSDLTSGARVDDVQTLDARLSESVASPRFHTLLSPVFAPDAGAAALQHENETQSHYVLHSRFVSNARRMRSTTAAVLTAFLRGLF